MAEIADIKSIKDHLAKDDLKHVYLFYGSEDYLKDLYTDRIRARLGCDAMNCFYFTSDADEKELDSICSSVSMFGDSKLVVISGSGFFKTARDGAFIDKANDSDTYIVFKEDDADKRNKLYKKVCDTGIVFNCKKQGSAEIKKVIANKINKSGRKVSESVLQYMIDGIGDDISRLLSETEKLILYVPEGGSIEKSHVDTLCSLHTSARVFDLNDAVAAGDSERAYFILKSLLEDKEPPVKLLAIISKMWSQLYSVKLLMQERCRASDIALIIGVKDFAASKLMKQASGMNLDDIKKRIALCEELDMSIKNGNIKDTVAAELITSM